MFFQENFTASDKRHEIKNDNDKNTENHDFFGSGAGYKGDGSGDWQQKKAKNTIVDRDTKKIFLYFMFAFGEDPNDEINNFFY